MMVYEDPRELVKSLEGSKQTDQCKPSILQPSLQCSIKNISAVEQVIINFCSESNNPCDDYQFGFGKEGRVHLS